MKNLRYYIFGAFLFSLPFIVTTGLASFLGKGGDLHGFSVVLLIMVFFGSFAALYLYVKSEAGKWLEDWWAGDRMYLKDFADNVANCLEEKKNEKT